MAKRSVLGIFGARRRQQPADNERPPELRLDLHQYLPFLFRETLLALLDTGEEPVAVLYVPSHDILGWHPGRALVILTEGVLVMEEGEMVVLDQKWGLKTRFFPYRQIAAIDIGNALLRGRFTIYGTGNAPAYEFEIPWYNLNNFRAAARLIRHRMGQPTGRMDHAHSDHLRHPRQLDGVAGRHGRRREHRPNRVSG